MVSLIMLPFFARRSVQKDSLILGKTKSFLSPFLRVTPKERAAHQYVIGLSGKGKSKHLEHCIFQDIAGGRGCGCIDPHSLLIDDLLRLLLTKRVHKDHEVMKRIIYIDPSREDYVVPFNVLDSPDSPYDTAASILEAFRRTWPQSLQEAPHFSNVVMGALLVLIQNNLTLMDMHRLLTNQEFREVCLLKVSESSVVEFFHDRYDRWGKEAPVMRESTLNKIGAFSLNPRLRVMLGQKENHLNFAEIMDKGIVLLLDLGHCDGETNKLIGTLVTTGLERAMRRRKKRTLWNLTIDEFSGYVANEGSVQTLAHVFSEGRKFRMGMTVAHQDLSQLTPRMLGALSNVQTKVIFGVGRSDAEFFAKMIGRVDTESVKRDSLTETQHEMFESLPEQWEKWVDKIRFQSPRQAMVALADGKVFSITTITIPPYQATDEEVEDFKTGSLRRVGIPYAGAVANIQALANRFQEDIYSSQDVPKYAY